MIFNNKGRGRPPKNKQRDEEKNLGADKIQESQEVSHELPAIKIRKLDEKASDPVLKSFGFKVFSGEEKVIITSKNNVVVDTKLEIEVPKGYYLRVAPSSSFGFGYDIVAFSGTLEEGRHYLKIKLYNNSNRVKEFRLGEALADIEVIKVEPFVLINGVGD